MKQQLLQYAFLPGARQIIFPNQFALNMAGFLIITNVASNTTIFNFADPSLVASLSGNVLTLTYNTTAMNVNDPLTIWYEDGASPTDDVVQQLILLNQTLSRVETATLMTRNALLLLLTESSVSTNFSVNDLTTDLETH